ncbi:hypothetical protein NDI38_28120 [Stenomitos frigidus AS-A4]|uniref:Uncharacterized protein n=1 Tax=Stenomitos frigidus AS-A4 TaxID=2933935 RepID=A0ABV0KSP5_9CYAN
MFPASKPEYDQIQDLKHEARQQLLRQEQPSNAFDCLFLVDHPKFSDFYDSYLRLQGGRSVRCCPSCDRRRITDCQLYGALGLQI